MKRPLGLLQVVRTLRGDRRLVVVATAHRVGSTWLHDMLGDLCDLTPWTLPKPVDERHPGVAPVDVDLTDALKGLHAPAGAFLWKSHSFPPETPSHEWIQWVTIIRDPRDVLVSASYYLASLPVDQGGWGHEFERLGEKDRILRLIEAGGFLKDRLRVWNRCEFAHKVRYEHLVGDSDQELDQLLTFLGVNVSRKKIAQVRSRHSSRQDRRKGVVGDWRTHFDEETIETFQRSDWAALLAELGYVP